MVDARRPVGAFPVLERVGRPEELVLQLPDPAGQRLAVLARPTADALVLGSTQQLPALDLDAARSRALSVLRRRSGGGAVLIRQTGQIWLDLYIPSGDPLAEHDVGRAARVVGELWRSVISGLRTDAPASVVVHEGALVASRFSRLVCFAGLGPGEVTCDGKKVVGLSQRRDRAGAWFFTLAHVVFEAEAHAELFPSLGPADQLVLTNELRARVAPLAATTREIERALLDRLS